MSELQGNPEPRESLREPRRILEIGVGGDPIDGSSYSPDHDMSGDHYVGIDLLLKEQNDYDNYLSKPKEERNDSLIPYLRDSADFTLARHEATARTKTTMNYMFANGKKMPFPDTTFDEILFANLAGDPAIDARSLYALLVEAGRVLKSEGRILLKENYTPDLAYDILDPKTIEALGFTMEYYNKFSPDWPEVSRTFSMMDDNAHSERRLPAVYILHKRPTELDTQG